MTRFTDALRLSLLLAALGVSCTTAQKKNRGGLLDLPNPLTIAEPLSESTIASLKALADDPASMLPSDLASPAEEKPDPAGGGTSGETTEIATAGKPVDSSAWRGPGLNPGEVNPGDIYSDSDGPRLRKVFSLIDETSSTERLRLLRQVASTAAARVPLTLSTEEIETLRKEQPGLDLPTRSVALDFRAETHTVDSDRLAGLLENLGKGDSGGAVESPERIKRLKGQLDRAKKRLKSGERLFVVTAVRESDSIHASYPGAPVGRRDATRLANSVTAAFPHLEGLAAEREDDGYRITGDPRILWEFDSRELKLRDNRLVVDPAPVERP